MMPRSRFDEPHRDGVRRATREVQVGQARAQARTAAAALGHDLGEWHAGGLVADDGALCARCRRAGFLTYGDRYLLPLKGLRRSGTALSMRCEGGR